MRNIFTKLMFVALVFAGLGAVGCSDSNTDGPAAASVELTIGSQGATYAGITVRTSGIAKIAYQLYADSENPAKEPAEIVLFATGKVVDCVDGNNTISLSGLSPNTTFHLYVAAQTTADTYYGQVLTTSFTTSDVSNDITIVEQDTDGFVLYVRTPQDVLDRGNAVRYGVYDIASYNYAKGDLDALNGTSSDASLLLSMPQNYCFGANGETSATIDFNNVDIIAGSGDDLYYARYPMAPGEPSVFIMGEFTGENFRTPLYDNPHEEEGGGGTPVIPMSAPNDRTLDEDQYWSGFHQRFMTSSLDPEPLDASFNVEVDVQDAVHVVVNLNPDPEIMMYSVFMSEDSFYKSTILPLLDNNEDFMPWFTGSYFCSDVVYQLQYLNNGPMQIDFHYHNYVYPNTTYHIFLLGRGDEAGYTQCFEQYSFTTPDYKLPIPEVVVTPIKAPEGYEESPYEVWFNVYCPTGDAVGGMYALDYSIKWEAMIASGATYKQVIEMGNAFSQQEIARINQPGGYDIKFTSLPDKTSRLGVILYNNEERGADPDAEGSRMVADNTTIEEPIGVRIDSPLFAELSGEWTATARVNVLPENGVGDWYLREEPMVSKITIAEGISYPEKGNLPQEVYDVYNKSKEEVDALYDEFLGLADNYNKRLQGKNRLLCMGWSSELDYLAYPRTPYELFYATDYSTIDGDTGALFEDFGPKWYLEVHEDGTVTAPISYETFSPMSAVYGGISFYLIGLSNTGDFERVTDGTNYQPLHFPVEVSDDRNTITIKPYVGKNDAGETIEYYPTPVYISGYGFVVTSPCVVSEIVLTRGWSGEETVPAAEPQMKRASNNVLGHGRRTTLGEPRKIEKREASIFDQKALDAAMQRRFRQMGYIE